MTTPERVNAVYPDGRTVPLELVDEGVDDDGLRVWAAVLSVPWEPGMRITVGALPARSAVRVELHGG